MNKKDIVKKVNEERQAVEAYSNKPIPTDKWDDILETIKWAPTSYGYEPYRVLVISKNNPIRQEIFPVMYEQGVVIEADKLIFFISLKRKVFRSEKFISERAKRSFTEIANLKPGKELDEALKARIKLVADMLDNQEKTDEWSMKQAYIALGMAMYTAAIHNIGSTPMEGFERDKIEQLFRKHKLMSEDEQVAVALALGYPKSKTAYAHWGSGKRVRDPNSKKFTII